MQSSNVRTRQLHGGSALAPGCQARGGGEGGRLLVGTAFLRGDQGALELDSGDGCTTVKTQKTPEPSTFKGARFMACDFYLN